MTTKQAGNRANESQARTPKLDQRFIITIDGKEFVTYQGLLDLGHQKGIRKIVVEILQFPDKTNDNFAICQAVIESSDGNIFTDIGDANPQNCGSRVSKHLLRMASTRAKARALRDMTNIGITCVEELDLVEGENGNRINHVSLKGDWDGFYRYHVGDYRIIYCIYENDDVVEICYIGHRKDIYKI